MNFYSFKVAPTKVLPSNEKKILRTRDVFKISISNNSNFVPIVFVRCEPSPGRTVFLLFRQDSVAILLWNYPSKHLFNPPLNCDPLTPECVLKIIRKELFYKFGNTGFLGNKPKLPLWELADYTLVTVLIAVNTVIRVFVAVEIRPSSLI